MNIIETVHLTKNYGEILALKNINLAIDEGEIFGLVGPDGAGKSTFIKVLLNFIFPSIGNAKIAGLDCVRDSGKIKAQIGYAPSDVRYYPNATTEELMKNTLDFHKKKNDDFINPLCEALNIDKGKKFRDLSLGNKKKAAIACAMVHEPRLLILDEPTNGLDPLIQKRFFELLKAANQRGASILIASHNLNELQYQCTKVGFIKEGRILKIEDLTKVRKTAKMIEMTADSFDLKALESLNGRIINATEKKVKFTYKGEMRKLFAILSEWDLKDITIKNTSLEDEFSDYYEGDTIDDTLEIGI